MIYDVENILDKILNDADILLVGLRYYKARFNLIYSELKRYICKYLLRKKNNCGTEEGNRIYDIMHLKIPRDKSCTK